MARVLPSLNDKRYKNPKAHGSGLMDKVNKSQYHKCLNKNLY